MKPQAGMGCPNCGCKDLRAWTTRKVRNRTERVRVCRYCGTRVTTYETIAFEHPAKIDPVLDIDTEESSNVD